MVPDFAEVFYYVRHPEAGMVEEIWKRVEAAAMGAAEGTGTGLDWEIIHGNQPLLVNETLAQLMDKNLREVGGVEYTAEEEAFARALHESHENPTLPFGSQEEIQPYAVGLGYGSTDVGDVSITVPTAGVRTATWAPGTSAHSWQAVAASGSTIGYKGAHNAAKVLALTAIDLLENPDMIEAAKAEFDERRGPDFEYRALLGDRDPPLDYRN